MGSTHLYRLNFYLRSGDDGEGPVRITVLLFADDVIFLTSWSGKPQPGLGRFSVKCEAAEIKISTAKSDDMVLVEKEWIVLSEFWNELLFP